MSRFIVVAPGSSEAAALATDELARVLGVTTVDALAGTSAADELSGIGEEQECDVDAVVADELSKRGELERIGGAPYLATLMATVPTAANAGYYARIVKDKALMRGLVQAGTRITQLGYSTDAGDIAALPRGALAASRALIRGDQAQVEAALRSGMGWTQIAAQLGVSRQAVHKKYARRVSPGLAPTRRG